MAHTRYGKSLVVALAILTRVSTFPEKWAILAGSQAKARIIMSYIIEHAFDNEYTGNKLDISKDESKRKIQREKSKNRLTFRHSNGQIGEVFILSGDSSNKQKAGEAIMGFGAPNVVLDEAALVDDQIESKIFRMLGDNMDNFYMKIGNPFKRNHFLKSSRDERYFKLNVDYHVGLKEGRINEQFIEEVKAKPNFNILFENKFPEADAIDERGWSPLFLEREIDLALTVIEKEGYIGTPTIGVDVARGGGCENVWVLRYKNYAKIIAVSKESDLMSVASRTINLSKKHGVHHYNVTVDDNGVGGGVTDRCNQMQFPVYGVKAQEKADDDEEFVNRRAENAWRVKEWLHTGGKLCEDDNWDELLDLKYMPNRSNGKIILMSKIDMAKEGLPSPDRFDALALTFTRAPYNVVLQKELAESQSFNPYDIV